MAKERSAAVAMLLVLAAIAWGVIWSSRPSPTAGSPVRTATNDPSDRAISPSSVDDRSVSPSPPIQLASRFEGIEPFPTPQERQTAGLAFGSKKPVERTHAESKPATLTAPQDALPLAPSADDNGPLRTMIKEVFPEADAAELRIWEKELRGLPLPAARDILQMRIRMPLHGHAGPMMPMFSKPVPVPNCPRGSEPFPQMIRRPSPGSFPPVVTTSLRTIERARQVILHNIANANTPGYKQSTVLFGEGLSEKQSTGGVEILAILRDWSTGPLQRTNRPTDVAISGSGFFVLKFGRTICYTRRGNFQTGPNNRIICRAGGKCYTVEVESVRVTVGEAITGIALSSAIRKARDSSCPADRCKKIALVRFSNPDGLKSLGGGLYAETPESGPPVKGKPGEEGFGNIRTGCLEQSNVDVEREMQTLQQLAGQRAALIAAAKAWDAPADLAPLPLPTANEPILKPAAMVPPKRRMEVKLEFNLRNLLPKLRFSASKVPPVR